MGEQVDIVTSLHGSTPRDYLARMNDDKIHCMEIARQYGEEFWDGDRRYGYGVYRYDGRWKPVAKQLIERYGLGDDARILDIGCGMGHLLFELKQLLPEARVSGMEISSYALAHAKEEIRDSIILHPAEKPYPFSDNEFNLVISLMTLHNLRLPALSDAFGEIGRVAESSYISVESYRSIAELFNLQCWALTCESFLSPPEWEWVMEQAGYTGDYEFLFFE